MICISIKLLVIPAKSLVFVKNQILKWDCLCIASVFDVCSVWICMKFVNSPRSPLLSLPGASLSSSYRRFYSVTFLPSILYFIPF